MRQEQFIQQHQPLWDEIAQWLDFQAASPAKRSRMNLSEPVLNFPQVYRQLCHHLALAQSRLYSPMLIERLNDLVMRGHNHLYSSRWHFLHNVAEFYLRTFPQEVRNAAFAVGFACVLFFGSFLGMMVAVQVEPDLVYSVLDGETVVEMESMYEPSRTDNFGRKNEADSDVLMFGHYIRNNTGIGFQCFAGGVLYGIGSLFFLLFNGLVLGAVAGHLTHLNYIDTFWGFVSGHSAFELTAIALSGGAGFKLAEALIFPRRKSRLLALRDNSQQAIRIVYGAATLFIMAAFVEAFWSSQAVIPVALKYGVGIFLWLCVIAYFLFVGRDAAFGEGEYAS